jgi:hypothetical protein
MQGNPTFSFLEQDVMISFLKLDTYPGSTAMRVGAALHKSLLENSLDGKYPELLARLTWFLRDYDLVGPIVVEPEHHTGPSCKMRCVDRDVPVDPYIFSIVMSALSRHGVVSGETVREAIEARCLELGVDAGVDQVRNAVKSLVDGTDQYRIFPYEEGARYGMKERETLELILKSISEQ